MKEYIDQVIRTMAIHRKHKKAWLKVRTDRLMKLVSLPKEIDSEEFLNAFLDDPRVKRVRKLDGKIKVPAVQLRYDAYRKVLSQLVHIK